MAAVRAHNDGGGHLGLRTHRVADRVSVRVHGFGVVSTWAWGQLLSRLLSFESHDELGSLDHFARNVVSAGAGVLLLRAASHIIATARSHTPHRILLEVVVVSSGVVSAGTRISRCLFVNCLVIYNKSEKQINVKIVKKR